VTRASLDGNRCSLAIHTYVEKAPIVSTKSRALLALVCRCADEWRARNAFSIGASIAGGACLAVSAGGPVLSRADHRTQVFLAYTHCTLNPVVARGSVLFASAYSLQVDDALGVQTLSKVGMMDVQRVILDAFEAFALASPI
jgi:hypothetical protein